MDLNSWKRPQSRVALSSNTCTGDVEACCSYLRSYRTRQCMDPARSNGLHLNGAFKRLFRSNALRPLFHLKSTKTGGKCLNKGAAELRKPLAATATHPLKAPPPGTARGARGARRKPSPGGRIQAAAAGCEPRPLNRHTGEGGRGRKPRLGQAAVGAALRPWPPRFHPLLLQRRGETAEFRAFTRPAPPTWT